MKKEKYYLCPNCNDLTTETQILEEISIGGLGMCSCKFNHGRILIPYKIMSKVKWKELKNSSLKSFPSVQSSP